MAAEPTVAHLPDTYTIVQNRHLRVSNIPEMCPRCSGESVVDGELLGQTAVSRGLVFRPHDRKWWSFLAPDARVSSEARACLDCGLLWSSVNSKSVKRVADQ